VVALEQVELLRGKIDGIFTPGLIFTALALSLGLGAAGGLYPALRAARMAPNAALRHE
jgi:ABC-type antimicrobial peptide transport system permease subunit